MSGQFEPGSGITGVELTQRALSSQIGGGGNIFIAAAIFFFAFTSIVANYSYAETNLVFLEHNHKGGLMLFRMFVLGMVMFGSVGELPTVWAMADVSMGLMAIVNLVAILLLSGWPSSWRGTTTTSSSWARCPPSTPTSTPRSAASWKRDLGQSGAKQQAGISLAVAVV